MNQMRVRGIYWIFLAVLAVMLSVGCVGEGGLLGKSTVRTKAKAVDRETARQMILAMPEVKALEPMVIANNGIGLAVHVSETPKKHTENGHRYWEVSVYENYPDHHPRYKTFLVRTDGEEILLLDFMD